MHYLFQYSTLSTLYAIILIAIYIVFTIIEIVRLYLGFLGNLTERVSNSIILLYAKNFILDLCKKMVLFFGIHVPRIYILEYLHFKDDYIFCHQTFFLHF